MAQDLTTLSKRQSVIRAWITQLFTLLKDLESKGDQPATFDLARQMSQKLESLYSDFKFHHYPLINLIDDTEGLLKEQDILDGHDNEMATLSTRIKRLIVVCDSSSEFGPSKIASQRLVRLGRNLFTVNERIGFLSGGPDDVCLLRQYEEQLRDLKVELGDICSILLSLGIEESDQLYTSQTKLDKELFDCSLKIKRLLFLSGQALDSTLPSLNSKGVKLPKLDIPKFDGNIINWRTFWEQFSISIHSRSGLSDAEKLVYLRHSLKNGTAKGVIEGLSRSGDCYSEAIESLMARYDRLRLIHQTHVCMILEATPLRDGTGKSSADSMMSVNNIFSSQGNGV